ncbi:DUF5011 domain-containing protein [Leucothrix pacifica]|uniref:Pesticidal crystal protein Cry22Aa Ig-like domain-containing protein n=1 Tax=Leucothrix pacifica TaxID=1247513 RepID=A0A317CDG8_9GAMM|nr:DUF5011 domain-containing protein [Leucothrix pacifica]PWQ96576.1 hypothetical protein DKW60_12395 [Leucothrix pacifica]
MKHSLLKPSTRSLLLPLLCSSLLVACVSEKKQATTDPATQDAPTSTQPTAVPLTTSDTTQISVQARSKESQFSVADTGTELDISISYTDVVAASHSQIFLNTDNDTSTGFSFDQEAWGVIGADYMVQDEYLYMALSDNADWDWQPIGRVSNYAHSSNQINMTISKSLIGNPCGSIQAGTMGRNDAWGVETMYPVAKELTTVSIANCSVDAEAPVVTLNGDTQITLTQGSSFTDPGATAIDNMDGDISSLIQTTGYVNTSTIGSYTLAYSATDSSGNVGTGPTRTVTIIESTTTLPPVGLNDDWSTLVNNQSLYAGTDTSLSLNAYQHGTTNDIYLNLSKSFGTSVGHIQIYLDTDNNPATGYQAWGNNSTSAEAGAEYMIEDGQMYQYTGAGIDWSWSNQPEQTAYSYVEDTSAGATTFSEMKSIFSSSIVSGDNVGIMIMKMSADWVSQDVFTPNSVYTLR